MKTAFTFFAIAFLLVSSSFYQTRESDWTLEKEKNGIRIFTRKSKSNLKDSRGITTIRADIKKALSLLLDFDRHENWMDRIKESRLLKKESDTVFYVYYEAQAPWPVPNRDIVSRYLITQTSDGKVVVEAIGDPKFLPQKEGIVRIKESISVWEIIPKGANEVEVIFTTHADPGGNVPEWLVNMTATDNPYNTLLRMKAVLEN